MCTKIYYSGYEFLILKEETGILTFSNISVLSHCYNMRVVELLWVIGFVCVLTGWLTFQELNIYVLSHIFMILLIFFLRCLYIKGNILSKEAPEVCPYEWPKTVTVTEDVTQQLLFTTNTQKRRAKIFPINFCRNCTYFQSYLDFTLKVFNGLKGLLSCILITM